MTDSILKTNRHWVGLDARHLCNLCVNRGQRHIAGFYQGNSVWVRRIFCGLPTGRPGGKPAASCVGQCPKFAKRVSRV